MDFNYKELGSHLSWIRSQRDLRQIDIEILSHGRLKQPSISALERGDTRIAVDTLIEYCNILKVRSDTVLDPFLTTPREDENSDAIIDSYAVQMAKLMEKCTPSTKLALLQIAELLYELQAKECP